MEAFDHIAVRESRPGVLRIAGELDVTGVPEVTSHVASTTGDVTIDCTELTFIDAAGLGMLVELHKNCQARGVKLVLAEPPECMSVLLELTGLDALLNLQVDGTRS